MNASSITFDPLLPWSTIAILGAVILCALVIAAWRGLNGWPLRALASFAIIIGLAQPSYLQEEREPLTDIVFLVVDETSSQTLPPRINQLQAAVKDLQVQLSGSTNDPVEVVEVVIKDTNYSAEIEGTLIEQELATAAANYSSDRIAGAIIVTDGQSHDVVTLSGFPAPVHILQTGLSTDWDRRLIVESAPAFGIVGETAEFTIKVENNGTVPSETTLAWVIATTDAGEPERFTVPVNESVTLELDLKHAGINLVHLYTPKIDTELTDRNNQQVVQINAVRDRLRVLLVSGEPYAGERTWRNLLKSDISVDLVHFTILRSGEKIGSVPTDELSLIAFPTRELFLDKIEDFDLIIFDRYRRRGILPDRYLENVTNYIRNGGAVLIATGPAFASVESIARGPLRTILPAFPTGRVVEKPYLPSISEIGERHPVTFELMEGLDQDEPWGRWMRHIDVTPVSGYSVLNGFDENPLLILDRVDKGRVAVLASDHAWLWSRGFEGGGPQSELLRRLAHWLMQEPELEEEVLRATAKGETLLIERQTLSDEVGKVQVIDPSGQKEFITLNNVSSGLWTAETVATENGVYRIKEGELETVVAVGSTTPKEFENPIGVSSQLITLSDATNGGIFALDAVGTPKIRRVKEGRVSAGESWLGLTKRDAYNVKDIKLTELTPPWLLLLLTVLFVVLAWRKESQ